MGDFSRDTFKLTNVLHQLITGEAVTNPKHYVGVRLQQGVPVLDADWNELEDIRRYNVQTCLRYFYGNGVPSGDNGFQIAPVTEDNDFKINSGIALLDGMIVVNPHPALTYNNQASIFGVNIDTLAPPSTGIRFDLVYLDTWEEEVSTSGPVRFDERLTNPVIGVETCTRIERRWVVRVAPGATDLTGITQEVNHAYLSLALLKRVEGENRILVHRITDLRRTDLNVAKYLKVPVHLERGADIVDSQRLAELLEALRRIFFTRLENEQLFVNVASVLDHDRTVVYFAVQHIMQVCSTGALQARTNNLTNADALQLLSTLYIAQDAFLTALSEHGNGDTATTTFINNYRSFLTGGPGIDGIQTPLAEGDLIGAYIGQQELNAWLSAPVEGGLEGNIILQYLSVSPFELLIAEKPYQFTVEFTSGVTSDQSSEVFDVSVTLSSDLWGVDRKTDEITLDNNGGKGVLVFTVVPSALNVQCEFKVVAEARRNSAIKTTQPGLLLELNVRPAVAAILLYAGPLFNEDGRLELSAAQLTSGFGTSVGFAINNRTDENHTYTLKWYISLEVGDETGWSPVAGSELQNTFPVAAQSTGGAQLSILGPTDANVVGNRGTLHVTLIKIDGVDLAPGDQETMNVNFIAV